MINVAHVVEDLNVGGLEKTLACIVTGLDKSKFNSKVWCLSRGGRIFEDLKKEGVDIELLAMPSSRDIFFLLRLIKRMRKEKIGILHTHGYTATTIGRLAGIFARTPVMLAHVHSTYWDYTRKQLLVDKFLSNFTGKIICCSNAAADFVIRQEGISSKRVTVIYNSVNVEDFSKAYKAHIREKNEFLVGCVASLTPHKGHRYLLEAAAYVKNNFKPKVKFVLAGDGILRKELEVYAQKLGILEQVEFKGIVLNIQELLASFDAAVLPSSEREGLGISLLEAMAAGKPVIGTNIGGIPEVIQDGENGLLVPPKNSIALAKAIISVLEDTQKAKKMGARAKTIAAEKFSSQAMIRKIEDLYQTLIERKLK